MKTKALIIADKMLSSRDAKTAHGLIRYCDRFEIVGIIDQDAAGSLLKETINFSNADQFQHNSNKSSFGVPIFQDITQALKQLKHKPSCCITGVATHGGIIPKNLEAIFKQALENQLSIVNGLHQCLSDNHELATLARKNNVTITDIRKSKKISDLRFWSGDIYQVHSAIVAILGTDCAVGKRTTARLIESDARNSGLNTHMIYSGQTGWLQGGDYGFIFDSTPNDFVGGELEKAIVNCWKNEKPDLILLEGQGSLRNPSGPCGSEFLLSGNAKGVILQHSPTREYFDGFQELKVKIPSIKSEIKLIENYGAEVIAIAMNHEGIGTSNIAAAKEKLSKLSGKPVCVVLQEGTRLLVEKIQSWIKQGSQ